MTKPKLSQYLRRPLTGTIVSKNLLIFPSGRTAGV